MGVPCFGMITLVNCKTIHCTDSATSACSAPDGVASPSEPLGPEHVALPPPALAGLLPILGRLHPRLYWG